MRWASSRRRHVVGTPSSAGDGLDERTWETLCESTEAAHRGDADGHVAPLLRFERETPDDSTVGFYLWYLLRYRVAEVLGRRPSAEDLHSLAQRYNPQFSRLIHGDQRQLEDTLLSVFALADEDRKVKGGDAVVMGSAALGVLVDDPLAELAVMRPHLARWWQQNKMEFGTAGTG
jgi:hypothetical protein